MKKFLNNPLVKWVLPLVGTVGSASVFDLTHPLTLSFMVGGVALNVVLSFGKKK